MSWWMYVVLPLAGLGAGLVGSVAGLASLVSYPMLLAMGLPPVTANVTNSVSLVFASAGSVAGPGRSWTGRAARLRWLALAAVAGGTAGSALLLLAPAETFEFVVPWLIAGASLAILLPRRAPDAERHRHHGWLLAGGVALVRVYGGFFGAAAGIVLLALFLAMTPDSSPGAARKNVLLGAANLVAASHSRCSARCTGWRCCRSARGCSSADGSDRSWSAGAHRRRCGASSPRWGSGSPCTSAGRRTADQLRPCERTSHRKPPRTPGAVSTRARGSQVAVVVSPLPAVVLPAPVVLPRRRAAHGRAARRRAARRRAARRRAARRRAARRRRHPRRSGHGRRGACPHSQEAATLIARPQGRVCVRVASR